jgi:hypothetical protein
MAELQTAFDRMEYDHANEWLLSLIGINAALDQLDVSSRELLIWRDLVRGVGAGLLSGLTS